MGELKTLIEYTCRQFERNFSAGDLARLVSDCFDPDGVFASAIPLPTRTEVARAHGCGLFVDGGLV